MKRVYSSGVLNQTPDFFIGVEVENTPAKGVKTLFCHGKIPCNDILHKLNTDDNCIDVKHIYLNSNHTECFDPITKIISFCELGYWVTFEIDHRLSKMIHSLPMHDLFIPFLSVKIEKVTKHKNLSIKIDDVDFNATNPGVWCFKLDELPDNTFNDWSVYTKDEVI